MKKLLLFTAVALFAFTTAQSQEFRIGAKAGVNIASLGGDSYYGGLGSLGSRTSFHIGGLVEIPLMGKDRKSTRLNSSHVKISYAVFCLKKKTTIDTMITSGVN